jgi:hypothetical protein
MNNYQLLKENPTWWRQHYAVSFSTEVPNNTGQNFSLCNFLHSLPTVALNAILDLIHMLPNMLPPKDSLAWAAFTVCNNRGWIINKKRHWS